MVRPLLVALCAASSPALAQPATDWFASLYTPEGVELRADERVFALYALFNAMGYDEAPITRRDPVPKRQFHPVRQRVRLAAASLDDATRARADAFFDAHALTQAAYLAYAVRLSSGPKYAPGPDAPRDLAGLDGLLALLHDKLKLGDLFEQVQDEYRAALRAYLKEIDAPLSAMRKLLKLKEDDEEQKTVLAVNLLDATGKIEAFWVGKDQVIVVGPSPSPDAAAVARELARLHVGPAVARKSAAYKVELPAGWRGSAEDYVVETAVRAASVRAAVAEKGQDAELEAHGKAGYTGVREMGRILDEFGKSTAALDQYLADSWPRVEAARKAR